jgi:hypothetical protein
MNKKPYKKNFTPSDDALIREQPVVTAITQRGAQTGVCFDNRRGVIEAAKKQEPS